MLVGVQLVAVAGNPLNVTVLDAGVGSVIVLSVASATVSARFQTCKRLIGKLVAKLLPAEYRPTRRSVGPGDGGRHGCAPKEAPFTYHVPFPTPSQTMRARWKAPGTMAYEVIEARAADTMIGLELKLIPALVREVIDLHLPPGAVVV